MRYTVPAADEIHGRLHQDHRQNREQAGGLVVEHAHQQRQLHRASRQQGHVERRAIERCVFGIEHGTVQRCTAKDFHDPG